jgi:ubiquinone/menaquinone biosynthesis C-methylase UbiE
VAQARYDAVAEFYVAGWSDACDDPATAALLDLAGPVEGSSILDVACGHGRVARALARRGARVVGVDISRKLLAVAVQIERSDPQNIEYHHVDLTSGLALGSGDFDLAVCNFGLSDIDDLAMALASVSGHCVRAAGSSRRSCTRAFREPDPCPAHGRLTSRTSPRDAGR